MGGRTCRFRAATLIDGNVHKHRTRLHDFEHLPRDQFGCLGSPDQHRTNHQISAW